jgi:3-hydroxyacyl-[acyl-carrier-protein] dehydratase
VRWFWIDKFDEFVAGQHAVATKSVTFSEAHVIGYQPGWPTLPSSLIIEGLAQCGGLLLGQLTDFRSKIVLAKINQASFGRPCVAGDVLTYRVDLLRQMDEGGIVAAQCTVNGEKRMSGEIVFAALGQEFHEVVLFSPLDLIKLLRALRLFEVGKYSDGRKIIEPVYMFEGANQQMRDVTDSMPPFHVTQ